MTLGESTSGLQWVAFCPGCDMKLNWWMGQRESMDLDGVVARHNKFFHGVKV